MHAHPFFSVLLLEGLVDNEVFFSDTTSQMTDDVRPVAPFNFVKMLQRPLSRPSKISIIDVEAIAYTRAIRLEKRVVPVTVKSVGTVDQPRLILTYPRDVLAEDSREIVRVVRRMFTTDVDIAEFYHTINRETVWTPLIQQLYGLRPIQDANLFESMVKIIIGQQLNVQFAATLVERLIDLGNESVSWNGHTLPVFPSPSVVARWEYAQLRALSFSQRKSEYVIDFARTLVNGHVQLDHFWTMSNEHIADALIPLRGLGRWTVECFLLFGLGRPDIMPAADIGVQNAIKKLYEMDVRPNEDRVRSMAMAWTPWRSYATYYLWQSLISTP